MGAVFCLLSAIGFGAMAIFGKLAYDDGVTVGDLLLVRFGIAALVMLAIVRVRGGFGSLPRRTAVAAFLMGAVGYAAQSASYFAALDRIDASLLTLLLYVYPVLVMVGAVVLRRERWSGRRAAALGLALLGMLLVLSGAAGQPLRLARCRPRPGRGRGLHGVHPRRRPRARPAIAAAPAGRAGLLRCGSTYAVATVVRGGPTLGFGAAGWGWLVAVALVSTVGAIILFFAGLARVGPSVASILSVLEPVVTIGLAAAVFGESLSRAQLLGGALVLAAVVVVQWPVRRPPAARPPDGRSGVVTQTTHI